MPDSPGDLDLTDPSVADSYDELPLWSAMAGQLLLRHLPIAPRLTVLDLGCGTGFPAIELAERLGPASVVYGLDIWAAALERARRKATVRGVRNAVFVRGAGETMPFGGNSFDLIVSNFGVNNFGDPAACLAECHRIARPGARLALTTNLRGHFAEFYSVFRSVLDPEGATKLDQHVDHRTTVERLDALLEAAGFRTDRVEEEVLRMRFADGTALLRHSFIRLGFLPAWRELVSPIDRVDVFGRLERALNAHAAPGGALELSVPLAYVEAVRTAARDSPN